MAFGSRWPALPQILSLLSLLSFRLHYKRDYHAPRRAPRASIIAIELTVEQTANIERSYAALKGMHYLDQHEILNVVRAALSPTRREKYFTLIYHRAILNVETILYLTEGKHFQAVAGLTRTIFELAVDIRLIDRIDNAIEKMALFRDIEKLKAARHIVDFKQAHPDAKVHTNSHEKFVAAHGKHIDAAKALMWPGKEPRLTHWCREKMPQRAKLVGGPLYEIHELQYSQLSWYIHSGITGVEGLGPAGFASLVGVAFNIALESYMQILEAIIDEFKIAKADPLIRSRMQYARMMPFTPSEQELSDLREGLGL